MATVSIASKSDGTGSKRISLFSDIPGYNIAMPFRISLENRTLYYQTAKPLDLSETEIVISEYKKSSGGVSSLTTYTKTTNSYSPKTLSCDSGDIITGCLSFDLEACTGGNLDIDPEVDSTTNSCSRGANDCDYNIQIVCLDIE